MADDRAHSRSVVVTTVLLGSFSLLLSVVTTLAFRYLVFLPPESVTSFLLESGAMAGTLALGGVLATAVSVLVYRRVGSETVGVADGRRWLLAAVSGPVVALPPGFLILVGTMGWAGMGLLLTLALTASTGYLLILIGLRRK